MQHYECISYKSWTSLNARYVVVLVRMYQLQGITDNRLYCVVLYCILLYCIVQHVFAHWQQASNFQPCGALSRFGKIEINAPITIVIIIIIIIVIISIINIILVVAVTLCPL